MSNIGYVFIPPKDTEMVWAVFLQDMWFQKEKENESVVLTEMDILDFDYDFVELMRRVDKEYNKDEVIVSPFWLSTKKIKKKQEWGCLKPEVVNKNNDVAGYYYKNKGRKQCEYCKVWYDDIGSIRSKHKNGECLK